MPAPTWITEAQDTQAVVARAVALLDRHGAALLAHPGVATRLEDYRAAIAATAALSGELGIPAICIGCAAREAVCCFSEVAHRYDEAMLLINGLLGLDLGRVEGMLGGCYFCGAAGCQLLAKHSFCLNYFCEEIKETLGPSGMRRLLNQVGRELSAQWELERVLLPILWRREGA